MSDHRRALAKSFWRSVESLALVAATLTVAVGCGEIEVAQLPLTNDFADCNDFSSNDEVATVDCSSGELRVLVSQPERSPIHIVPFRFDPSEPGLAVAADVRLVRGKGAYGVGCAVSAPGEPGRGYLFLLIHGEPGAEGMATITRLDWTEAEGQTIQGVRFKRNAVLAQKPHRVLGRCVNAADGSAGLRMTVDGQVVVEGRDKDALGPFTAAIPVVIASAPDSVARFANLRVEEAQP